MSAARAWIDGTAWTGILLLAALAALAALALTGCASMDLQPAPSAPTLDGQWQRDAAASDDFDRKLNTLLETLRHRTGPHHGMTGDGGGSGGSGGGGGRRGGGRSGGGGGEGDASGSGEAEGDVLTIPMEEPDKARARLADDLRPPGTLRIAMNGAVVSITRDAEPTREFYPGQSVSRIDTSGAATLTSGWNKHAFVIRARYTDRATRSWRYELEPASGLLRVSFDADDPEFGRLQLVTRYRRLGSER